MIDLEVGEDVFRAGEVRGKLALFELWLYGCVSEVTPRLAPSIIARSEAELLGISSPRFAIRVYLNQGSFANIRRRKVTARQIRLTYEEALADDLQGLTASKLSIRSRNLSDDERQIEIQQLENTAYKRVNWIADCLLVPPKRLVDENYRFLTCCLGADYGEDDMGPATPFVTHISIGGGLCAQAACFMALCLMEHSEIYGISEITLLASEEEGKDELEIHGLKPNTMVRFFEKIGLSAQLQEGSAPEAVRFDDEKAKEIEWIRTALRIYVDNRIPILPMLSASRMQGLRPLKQHPSIPEPIIVSCGDQFREGSDEIPLGTLLNYSKSTIVDRKDLTHDNHCVVIVGRNKDATSFLLNDPATFPFMKCTPAQLYEARAYRSFARDMEIESRKYVLNEVTEKDLGRFQFISVGPARAKLWLLNLAGDADPQRGGLLKVVQNALGSPDMPLGLQYDNEVRKVSNLDLHLGRWSESNGFEFRSELKLDADLAAELKSIGWVEGDWYWVSCVRQPDKTGQYTESFSFWHASKPWCAGIKLQELLRGVFARRKDGSLQLLKGERRK